MSQRILKNILVLLVLCVFGYVFLTIPKNDWLKIFKNYFPCQYPISYSLGSIDPSFNVSEEYFLKVIKEAEKMWEEPIDRNLFEYHPSLTSEMDKNLTINLIYDYRQEATEKIKNLGTVVENTRASYDALKAKFAILQENYLKNKDEYKGMVASFEMHQTSYNKKVQNWNRKGGAPENIYNELKEEENDLKIELTRIHEMEDNINQQVADINALVSIINKLAEDLNINVGKLGTLGLERGEEFTQGEYVVDDLGERINIYEFSVEEKLKRVLAHELGHALGLGHVDEEEAVMYRLNEGKSTALSEGDLDALKAYCQIK